jgi:hypothetical protein
MSALDKLADIASAPLSLHGAMISAQVRSQAGSHAQQLEHILTRRNGFFAFEGALHVFPATAAPAEYTLEDWNAPDVWRDAYGHLAEDGLYFAEDVFGNQFLLRDSKVHGFDAETAETTLIADDLEGWAAALLAEYDSLTGYPLAHEWQLRNGPVPAGHRLVPKRPFVIGGGYEVDNLRAVPVVRGMRWRGEIARQLVDLPDGESVKIKSLP